MVLGAEQKPLNRAGRRRIALGDDLADHKGAVEQFPGRTTEVSADLPALPVEKICLGRLERPVETALFGFAAVDLNPVRAELEQYCGTFGRGERSLFRAGAGTMADQ